MSEDDAPQPPAWEEVEKHEQFSKLTPEQKAQTLQNWVDKVHAYGVAKGSWNEGTEKQLNETVTKKAQSFYSPAPQSTQALAATEKPQTFQPIGGEASISPAKTLSGEIQKGNFSEAVSMLHENILRPFSGLIGPTEKQRFEDMIEFGKNEDGSPKYEYKPLGDRFTQESGLFTPFIKQEFLQAHPDDNAFEAIGKAAFNTAAGTVGSFLSPAGVMLPAAGVEGVAGKAITGLFTSDMLAQVPEQIHRAMTADTTQGKIEGWLGATTSLAMAALGVKHLAKGEKAAAPTREEIKAHLAMQPDEILQGAASEPDFQKSSPDMHAAIVSELDRRGVEPKSAEDIVAIAKTREAAVAAKSAGATETAKELETKMVKIQNNPAKPNEHTQPKQKQETPPEPASAPQQPGSPEGDGKLHSGDLEVPKTEVPKRTFKTRPPVDSFGSESTPVSAHIINDLGGLVSKSSASKFQKGNGALWDDAPRLEHPTHNKVYNPKGMMPDRVAQALFDAGLISEPTTQAMWQAIKDESKSARSTAKGENISKGEKQFNDFQKDKKTKGKGDEKIKAEDLKVGDTVTIGTENLKVTDIDPETFDVTLEDGKKYGVQMVADGEVIYGIHEEAPPVKEGEMNLPDARKTEAQLAEEKRKKDQADAIAEEQNRRLIAPEVEIQQDMLGKESDVPLFDQKKKQEMILWGRKPGDPWIKLTDNTSNAEMARRQKDGWEVLRQEKGTHPDDILSPPKTETKALADDWLGATEDLRDEMPWSRVNEDGIPGTIPQQAGKPVGQAGEGPQGESKWRPAPDKSAQAHERITGVPAESAFAEVGYDPAKQWGIRHLADLFQTTVHDREASWKLDTQGPIYRTDYPANKAAYQRAAQIAKEVFLKTVGEIDSAYSGYKGTPSLYHVLPRTKEARALFTDKAGTVHLIDHPGGEFPFEGRQAKLSDRMKKNLAEKNKTGGINTQILNDLVDYGHRVYQKGMTYAKWSAQMVKEFGKGILNHTQAAWSKIKQIYSEAGIHTAKKFTELDWATTDRGLRLQRSFADAEDVKKEIKKAVPDENRQGAISVWLEANGDAATLQQWAAGAKGKAFKAAAEAALNLSPAELAIATKARGAFDALEAIGNRYDVLGSHRDNYVPHVWEVENKATGVGSSRLQDKFKFAKARTFNNFFEGDQAGFTPKALAIGKLLPSYLHEMNRVIADREFIRSVTDKTASDGRPLVIPRGNAQTVDSSEYAVMGSGKHAVSVHETEADALAAARPGERVEKREMSTALVNPRGFAKAETATGEKIAQSDYKVIGDQPALSGWRWVTSDQKGNSVLLKGDLSVHPDLAKRITSAMGKSAFREWYNTPATGLSVIPKAIVKGLDTAQSVAKREMFSFLAPFHQVQEGTHAIGHLVNPFYNVPKPDMKLPAVQDAVRHGVILFPEKGSSQSYLEGVGGKGSFITQASRKFGGNAGEVLSNIVDDYQDYLFHSYIPGLKMKTYAHILERNMDRMKGDITSGKVTETDVKALSATQTNAAYGHLNYALMDRNPTMQHLLQLGLLAPDFLEARARFVGQALKSTVGGKAGHEQLRAIATLAVFQAASAYTISTLGGGKYDPKHPFEVRIGNRSYFLRSIPEDLMQLGGFLVGDADSTRQFVSGRINPLAGKVGQLVSGRNYRGEETGAMDTMGEMLTNYIPITLRSMPGLRDLTKTSKNNPLTPLEQLAGSFGLKVSRYSPITKTYEIADKWMEKNGTLKPKGVYPTSKYQGLRYALEDGDLARAKGEYEKLLKSSDASKVAKGFHESIYFPFTGSRASDSKFSSELSDGDRLIYDHAMETKRSILEKFNAIPDLQAGAETEDSTGSSRVPTRGGYSIKRRSR